ncbi:MAG: molecular chaperone HtpG [Clostridiales bacterium]|nr:molecular chaperone HtpG [Clostridiales bacterium]
MKKFKAESKKLLDLVVNSIYTNREIFLRELISNASDAIDKRKFMSLTDASLDADFCIEIKTDESKRTITITDNGVGMTETELENNLGVIAASGTEAFKKERAKVDGKSDGELIGQFGVGFYSAFMVADNVTVISRKVGEKTAHKWESDGAAGFEVTECERDEAGTTVILHAKPDDEENYSQYLDIQFIKTLVKKYSDYIRYPIRAELPKRNGGDVEVSEMTVLNSMTPVWKKQKKELGERELEDFYLHTYHDYRDPIMHISARIEGAVEYTALLFVPSEPSYDYFTKDYKRGLSLYCNGVLIMDKCAELIPEYLGFVRGVVDTPDLNLNISRETLQHDRRLRAIATGLEKKILSEFAKLLKNDRDKYDKLFVSFAKALKFGAYDNYGENKDKLKDLLLYYSDKEKKHITFKEYVDALGEDKTAPILYACGETVDKISMLPQLELSRDNGRDVLYFTDVVDEFVARMLDGYDGHKFENIASSKKNENSDNSDEQNALLKRIGDKLKDKVSVCATDKLKSYPVCLAAKGEVSLEMERVMAAMGGAIKAERVLQVNLDHPVISSLDALSGEAFDDTVTVLYNEALLAEGYKTEPEFLPALNRLLAVNGGAHRDADAVKTAKATKTTSKSAKTAKPNAKDDGADEK